MKIIVAGDFCPQNRVAELIDKGDYSACLGEVKKRLEEVDYAIVNFECPVKNGEEKPIMKQGPNLCCSEKAIDAVKWAGFDCVTLANNHFLDYGEGGVRHTLEACSKYGVDTVGGGINLREASRILYKKIGEKNVAIVNCCEHEFSIATDSTAGSNPINPIQQYYAIQEARSKAEYVIVITHGGHEYYQLPSTRMVELYRFFVDTGADAVINHHQHCYSGYEVYKEKPIFYGIGNFCFDGNRSRMERWYEGYMVELLFEDRISFSIMPYIQCREDAKVCFQESTKYDKEIERFNQIIQDPNLLKGENEKYYSTRASGYSEIFEPCNNRFYLSFKSRGWLPSFITPKRKLYASNYINCEAHRDILFYYLSHING